MTKRMTYTKLFLIFTYLDVMDQLNDHHARYYDGAGGGWQLINMATGWNPVGSSAKGRDLGSKKQTILSFIMRT